MRTSQLPYIRLIVETEFGTTRTTEGGSGHHLRRSFNPLRASILETLFACFDVTLMVLEPGEEKTPEQELTDDLLALIASFSGRLYGMRSHKQKELL